MKTPEEVVAADLRSNPDQVEEVIEKITQSLGLTREELLRALVTTSFRILTMLRPDVQGIDAPLRKGEEESAPLRQVLAYLLAMRAELHHYGVATEEDPGNASGE